MNDAQPGTEDATRSLLRPTARPSTSSRRSPARTRVLSIGLAAMLLATVTGCRKLPLPLPIGPPPPTTTVPPPTSSPTPPPTRDTWRLVGGDEFNGNAVDPAAFKAYYNNYGDGGGSYSQCNTPNNVSVYNGSMKITARRQAITCPHGGQRRFTTGFIGSRDAHKYYPRFGLFEMRARIPHGQGLWPAFWLRHVNGAGVAEIDIMEYLHTDHPGYTSGTVHLDGRYNLSKKYVPFEPSTTSPSGWHTWGVDIEPSGNDISFTFYLDGHAYHQYVDTQHHWASANSAATWDIAVNLVVGGDWTGDPDDALGYLKSKNRCAQGGTPPLHCVTTGIRRAEFPATYEVDWVRVFTKA